MLLSVIVTIVDGGAALARCLEALRTQRDAPEMEILVPFDDSVRLGDLAVRADRQISFVTLGPLPTTHPKTGALGQHELFDRRRAAGLAAARGELVAMLEDRGVPRPDWAASFARLHRDLPHAAIGGAIDIGPAAPLNRAVYYCDFGRYQPPFHARASAIASDINVCYKRGALETVRPFWAVRFHEPIVHDALIRAGETIFLAPQPVVDQVRGDLRLGALCAERLAWGQLYGRLRSRSASGSTRLMRIAATPLLPVVLFARLFRDRLRRRGSLGPFLAAAPYVAVLLCVWSVGEAVGYAVSRDDPAMPA